MGGAAPGPPGTGAARGPRGVPPRVERAAIRRATPNQSPKQIPRSRADSIVSLSSGTVFMRLTAALSGS